MLLKNYRCPSCNPSVCPNKAVAPCVAHREIVSTKTLDDGSLQITLQDGTRYCFNPPRMRQEYQQVFRPSEAQAVSRFLFIGLGLKF